MLDKKTKYIPINKILNRIIETTKHQQKHQSALDSSGDVTLPGGYLLSEIIQQDTNFINKNITDLDNEIEQLIKPD